METIESQMIPKFGGHWDQLIIKVEIAVMDHWRIFSFGCGEKEKGSWSVPCEESEILASSEW